MTPLFYTITARQISILQGTCYNTARKEYQRVKDVLGLTRGQPLMLRHLAAAWDAQAEDLAKALHMKYR